MFELYDIFDNNELNIIFLTIFIIILIIIIVFLSYYFARIRNKLITVERELKNVSDTLDLNINNNMFNEIPNNNSNNSKKVSNNKYKKKYEELLEEKNITAKSMQYSPSEYATLLKYNPILPYSAFTMDIINNAYLDMNERGMYENKYFALSNYDNIYDRTSNNNNINNNNTISKSDINAADMSELGNSNDNPEITVNNNNNSVQPETNSQNDDF